jgi:hypothetical protein
VSQTPGDAGAQPGIRPLDNPGVAEISEYSAWPERDQSCQRLDQLSRFSSAGLGQGDIHVDRSERKSPRLVLSCAEHADMAIEDGLHLAAEIAGISASRHRQGTAVNAETCQRIGMVINFSSEQQFQIEIPVCRVPQLLVQAADLEVRIAPYGWCRDGDEVLDEQAFQQQPRWHGSFAARQRTAP